MGGQGQNNTQVQMIAVAEIDFGTRLREPDPAAVEALKNDIDERGLRSPIEVTKRGGKYKLVAGGHRLSAAKALGWETIPAFVITGNAVNLRRDELLENLTKAELSYLERAVFVHELRVIWEDENPDIASKHGGDRVSAAFQDSTNVTWSDAIVQRSGLSRRTLIMVDAIGRDMNRDAAAAIKFTPLAHNQKELEALSKVSGEAQVMIARHIASGQSDSVKAARQALTPSTDSGPEPICPALATLMRAWTKANDDVRGDFLTKISAAFIQGEGE